jgi:hypothetical protein
MTTRKPTMVCCICRGPIGVEIATGWAGGRNAEPIMFGRCCAECDDMVVQPTRQRRAGIAFPAFHRPAAKKAGDNA